MRDYQQAYDAFDLETLARDSLQGSLDAMNACQECCDRHALPGRIALFREDENSQQQRYTFVEIRDGAARFANVLHEQGVCPGDCVSGLLPRGVELLITILGAWRAGAVYQPLFTAFGPKAISHRVEVAKSRVIVTDGDNRAKLEDLAHSIPIVTVGGPQGRGIRRGDFSFWEEIQHALDAFEPVLRHGDDPFLMMFTSGTTGLPKGVPVPLKALLAIKRYMLDAIGLREDDAYWNIADPGWAYGLYYAVTGPLALGHPTTFYAGGFTVDAACRIIRRHAITNLAGAPTAFRLLMAHGDAVEQQLAGRLRVVSSAGEPLTPEVIRWFDEVLQTPIHDHYGQTEVGMVVCNHHALDHPVRRGSAGYSTPGHRVVIVDDIGNEQPVGTPGMLAVDRSASPLFSFPGYLGQPEKSFLGNYYLTGDTAQRNADDSISFVGRSDDVITTSGYRVGPFDVESALMEHPDVVEAAVVGKPDPERTERVKAFVVLKPGARADDALCTTLQNHVREQLSAHAYPREIEFIDELPKTPSGKIQRFVLREQA